MLQDDRDSVLIAGGQALRWSPAGYRKTDRAIADAMLLTPPSSLRALKAGYRPALLHPSATALTVGLP